MKIRTTINLSLATFTASEYEAEIEVDYTFRPGCQQTYTQPGEPDTVEITAINVIEKGGTYGADWLIDLICEDDDLHIMCLQDATERAIDADEARAEARREELMERGQ